MADSLDEKHNETGTDFAATPAAAPAAQNAAQDAANSAARTSADTAAQDTAEARKARIKKINDKLDGEKKLDGLQPEGAN